MSVAKLVQTIGAYFGEFNAMVNSTSIFSVFLPVCIVAAQGVAAQNLRYSCTVTVHSSGSFGAGSYSVTSSLSCGDSASSGPRVFSGGKYPGWEPVPEETPEQVVMKIAQRVTKRADLCKHSEWPSIHQKALVQLAEEFQRFDAFEKYSEALGALHDFFKEAEPCINREASIERHWDPKVYRYLTMVEAERVAADFEKAASSSN